MAFANGYDYRKQIDISSSDISGSGTISNAKVFINLTLDIAKVTDTNGYDVIFETTGGSTIPHELISYDNSTGDYQAFVRLDLDGTSGNSFYVYYGNSGVSSDQSDASTVWTEEALVMHLKESASTSSGHYKDSSGNNNHGTAASTPTSVAGTIGAATSMAGNGISGPISATGWSQLFMQIIAKPNTTLPSVAFARWFELYVSGSDGFRFFNLNGSSPNWDMTVDADDGCFNRISFAVNNTNWHNHKKQCHNLILYI